MTSSPKSPQAPKSPRSLPTASGDAAPRSVRAADLRHCETEAIHQPETIQAYGGLVVCEVSSGRILRHSDNLHLQLGLPEASFLGQTFPELLGASLQDWALWSERASNPSPALVARVRNHAGTVLELLAHALQHAQGS